MKRKYETRLVEPETGREASPNLFAAGKALAYWFWLVIPPLVSAFLIGVMGWPAFWITVAFVTVLCWVHAWKPFWAYVREENS